MGTFCLSSAPILRCETLSPLQAELLVVPTGLEVIFSTCLIVAKWGSGRKYLFLAAEGWVYLALAVLEMLSHIIPAVRASLRIFIPIDVTIAALSFLPVLLYTVSLWIFVNEELVQTLPKRFQRVASYIFLLFIPLIIALNEIASFIGIKHGLINNRLGIGFRTPTSINLWTFFTALTLALLTSYQVLVFCIAFYRLVKGFVDLRQIESSSTTPSATYLFRGLPWLVLGLKFGAVETVVGFVADGGFGMAMTRRILRFVSRAIIVIGFIKGLDSLEDFNMFQNKVEKKSSIRDMISNPRYSTFQRLPLPADSDSSNDNTPAKTMDPTFPLSPTLTSPNFVDLRPRPQQQRQRLADRVTVIGGQDNAPPVLQMHFSALELPSFATIVEHAKGRADPKRATAIADLEMGKTSPPSTPPDRSRTHLSAPAPSPDDALRDSRATTTTADSFDIIEDIAAQFPPLPLPSEFAPTLPSALTPRAPAAAAASTPTRWDRDDVLTRPTPAPLLVVTGQTAAAERPFEAPQFALSPAPPPPRPPRSPARSTNAQAGDAVRLPAPPENALTRPNRGSVLLSPFSPVSPGARTLQSEYSPTGSDVATSSDSDTNTGRYPERSRDGELQQASIVTAQRTRVSRDLFATSGRPESLITAYRRQRATTAHRDVLKEGEEARFAPAPERPAKLRKRSGSSGRDAVVVPPTAVLRSTPRAVEQSDPRESMRVDGIVLPSHQRQDGAAYGSPLDSGDSSALARAESERSFFED